MSVSAARTSCPTWKIGSLSKPVSVHADARPISSSWVQQALKGAGTSGLNPKVLLLFLALLPQFTHAEAAWPFAAQIMVLGLIHTASCAVVYTAVGSAARMVLRARPLAARAVTRISGAAMIEIGVLLLAEQLIT